MPKISNCLWFDSQAEEAARFYVSVFSERGGAKLKDIVRYGSEGFEIHGGKKGTVMSVSFEILGQEFAALNGGPIFQPNESYSIVIDCETQEEIDYFWKALQAGGGQPSQCGWLKDRWGVSWQVSPSILKKWMVEGVNEKTERVTKVFMQMQKFDLAALKRAYEGK